MEDRRTKEALTRFKETQETSRKAKLVYRKVEDLSFEESTSWWMASPRSNRRLMIHSVHNNLAISWKLVGQEIHSSLGCHLRHTFTDPDATKTFAMDSHTTILAASEIISWSLPQLSRSQPSLLNPSLPPLAQAQPKPLFQHSLMPQHPSAVQP